MEPVETPVTEIDQAADVNQDQADDEALNPALQLDPELLAWVMASELS